MFAASYFAPVYFTEVYFPPVTGDAVEPPIEPPIEERTLGGSPGGVRRHKKYVPPIEDSIRDQERINRIMREDEEIIEFIKVILTKGLI